MFTEPNATIVHKRHSFLSVVAMSVAAVLMTLTVCGTGVVVYGLRVLDHRADNAVALLGDTVRSLPDLRKALPPALTDAFDDERRPEYAKNLKISIKSGESTDRRGYRLVAVEVENAGEEVVSLLSMRVVGLNTEGNAADERSVWVATPLQLDHDWRGPLLPHETRRFPVLWRQGTEQEKWSHEITDIRIWSPKASQTAEPPAAPVHPQAEENDQQISHSIS